MIVVCLDLRPVQTAMGGKDRQVVLFLHHLGAAFGQFIFQGRHAFAFLHAQALQTPEARRFVAKRRNHDGRHDAVTKMAPVAQRARELALTYGLGHMVRQSSDGRTVAGSTSAAAADLGIPSFTAESGECGILARDAVDRHLRGLRNVLRHLRLLPGEAVVFDRPVEHDGWIWMRTADAGWWQPAVGTGASVAALVRPGVLNEPRNVARPLAGTPDPANSRENNRAPLATECTLGYILWPKVQNMAGAAATHTTSTKADKILA